MILVGVIDLVVVSVLLFIALGRGLEAALHFFAFALVLLPTQSQFQIPGLFVPTTQDRHHGFHGTLRLSVQISFALLLGSGLNDAELSDTVGPPGVRTLLSEDSFYKIVRAGFATASRNRISWLGSECIYHLRQGN
jgi:hypothetical protein